MKYAIIYFNIHKNIIYYFHFYLFQPYIKIISPKYLTKNKSIYINILIKIYIIIDLIIYYLFIHLFSYL